MRTALRTLLVCAAALAGLAAAQGTDIVLENGVTCKAVGPETNVSVANGRVTHFCEEGVALVGDLQLIDDVGMVTRVSYDPNDARQIRGDELVAFEVRGVTLTDGTKCLHAGRGATLGFASGRVNYTCDGDLVLVGPFEIDGNVVAVTRGTVMYSEKEGFSLANEQRVEVETLDGSSPLAGHEWTLKSFGRDGTRALLSHPVTFELVDGQVVGSAGCNRYFAPLTFGADGTFSIGPAGATMMFCEGAMEQERRFLDALGQVDAFRITPDDELVLSGGGEDLVFTR